MDQVKEKPPYVVFEYRPVEDRTQTIAQGRFIAKDVAFAKITRPGSRDTLEVEAESWLNQLKLKASRNEAPAEWATGFREMFERWKKGEDIPLEGTPLKGWPVISPAAQVLIGKAGFRTVEELASAGDAEVSQIGTGAIEFRNKAKLWLEQASGPGKLVERVNAMDVQLKQVLEINAKQAEEIKSLRAQLPQASQ